MTAAPRISISFLKMKLERCFEFVLLVFFSEKKEERMLKQKHDISDGLFGATGIHQKCLSNSWLMIKSFYH